MTEPKIAIFELQEKKPAQCVFSTTPNAPNPSQFIESTDQRKRRVFLVEGTHATPCLENCQACLLHQFLGVPERFFREHEKQNVTFAFNEEIHFPKLPSRLDPSQRFHLSYFDLRIFKGDPLSISFRCPITNQNLVPGSDGDLKMTCSKTGREIQCHKWQSRGRETLFIVPRKCSFWVKEYSDGGWDAIILCDPELSHGNVGNIPPINLTPHEPFNADDFDGYLPPELAKKPDASTTKTGPPRTGMYQDLHYCFTNYSHLLQDLQNPQAATLFPRKIVAAHYEPLLAFSLHQTRSMRSRGWALKGDTEEQKIEAAIVESEWSRFRFSEYLEAMRENLDALGVSRPSNQTVIIMNDWKASDFEFQWIYQQLVDRRRDYELLTGSMAALAGIIGNRKTVKETSRVSEETMLSRQETKAMKTFSFPNLIITTFSLAASWYSMGSHAPGEKGFRIYWVVALSITTFFCMIVFIVNCGYTEELDWFFGRAWSSVRKNVREYMQKRGIEKSRSDKENSAEEDHL